MKFLRLLTALARRRYAEARANRYRFGVELLHGVVWMGALVVFGKLVLVDRLGGAASYVGFVAWGIAAYLPVATAVTGPTTWLRAERAFGTLEGLLLSRTPLPRLILAAGVLDAATAVARALLYVALGAALARGAGVTIGAPPAPLPALAGVVLAFLAAHGLGLTGCGLDLVLDRGRSVTVLGAGFLSIAGGVYFPTDLFPAPFDKAVWLLPIVPLGSMLRGGAAGPALTLLLLEAALYLALGRVVFRAALSRAKRVGTLARDP